MKTTSLKTYARPAVILATVALLGAGCGDQPPPADERAEADPAPAPVTEITITGDDMMRFDPTEFTVRAGEEITLTFHNIGEMPKEAMGHNLAVLQATMDPGTFAAAAIRHPANAYIPPEYEDQVIATTDILGPGEIETLVFTAPPEPGEYPFVCSFPGHTPAGMKGIMTVIP